MSDRDTGADENDDGGRQPDLADSHRLSRRQPNTRRPSSEPPRPDHRRTWSSVSQSFTPPYYNRPPPTALAVPPTTALRHNISSFSTLRLRGWRSGLLGADDRTAAGADAADCGASPSLSGLSSLGIESLTAVGSDGPKPTGKSTAPAPGSVLAQRRPNDRTIKKKSNNSGSTSSHGSGTTTTTINKSSKTSDHVDASSNKSKYTHLNPIKTHPTGSSPRSKSRPSSSSWAVGQLSARRRPSSAQSGGFGMMMGPVGAARSSEYYGFALYLLSSVAFGMYLLWATLPSWALHSIGITYYPDRWWAVAVPAWIAVSLMYVFVATVLYNVEHLTLPVDSIENLVDECGVILPPSPSAVVGRKMSSGDWLEHWNKSTDGVLDVPLGGVCQILYGSPGAGQT